MKEQLEAVVDELRRLKREGVASLPVSEESIAALRAAVERQVPRKEGADVPASIPASRLMAERDARGSASPAPTSVQEAGAGFEAIVAHADRASPPAVSETLRTGKAGVLPVPPVVELPSGTKRERWEWLRDRVLNCPVCRAHTHGDSRVVFGVGNIDAEIFFCGEAPGREEEQQGEPFVGPAGKLLTKMIVAMGLRREDVYIGNILNWRPEMEGRLTGASIHQTGNRPPSQEEMRFGLPYLRAQVEVVAPKVIVALGSTAAEGLLGFGAFKSLGEVRGRWHTFNGTPLMVTYHPSYLLRNASNRTKRVVWEDLLKVMEKVGLPISEKQQGYFL